MASRAARAAARQKKLKETVDTAEIEFIDESHHQKAELTASVSSNKKSQKEDKHQHSRKKVGTPLVRKLQENSVRNRRGKTKPEADGSANEEIEEIQDEESGFPKIEDEVCTKDKKKINRKDSRQQKVLSRTTCDQKEDDSDACSIEEIDCEHELLGKDSKRKVLKEILDLEDAKEREDETEIITLDEEESVCTIKSTGSIIDIDGEDELLDEDVAEKEVQNVEEDEEPLWFDVEQESTSTTPKHESNDEELEVLFSKVSELDSSVEKKCSVPPTLADNEEKIPNTNEELSKDIQVKKDNDDNEISCEKDSHESSHSSGRPWAVSAKEWVAKPVEKIDDSERKDDMKNIENLLSQNKTGKDFSVNHKEKSVNKEMCLNSMQVRADVHQNDINSIHVQVDVHQNDNYLDINDKQTTTVASGCNDSVTDDTAIDEELSLHPDEEDLLMDTTAAVGTDVNLDDSNIDENIFDEGSEEKIADPETDENIVDAGTEENIADTETDENTVDSQDETIDDQDFIEETSANIDENSDDMVHEDIPNVAKLQGLYYPDNFTYRVENFEGMCEDEYHRIIVVDDGVFSPKPNNRFALTLITVDKGGLDFVGIALRETLKNLASENKDKLFLIRFVCGLCNIVYKYKYNQSNGTNIPCCGDCCLWSVRGDFENFYEDYNKLWKSIQSEFPEAVFIPTALPSINVKNISIFNQHEYCCPHIPTHFSISGDVVDSMQALFNKSMKFINPALNNLCFEMGFQRIYWTKERNRSRWKALMKAMQSDSAVARNLQVQKKFTPGDSEANVAPENIVNIEGDLLNEELGGTTTAMPTGFSQDNLQSTSSPSNDDPNSTAADNSKAQTQGDTLSQQQEKTATTSGDPLSEEAKKARAARFGVKSASKTSVSDIAANHATTTESNMKDEEIGVSGSTTHDTEKYNTAVALKRVREIMAMASSKQNESSDQQQDGQRTTEDAQGDRDVNNDETETTNQESDETRSGSPKRSWINHNNNKSGNLNESGNNWKSNTPWKHKQSYNKPWNNNPMWRNNNRNYNNQHHYKNNRPWNNNYNNNNSWSNNRPWQKQWNGSSNWNNHSYNPNNYNRSYGSRGHYNNNQSNKRKWNETRNNNSLSNAKHSKIEFPSSSSSNNVQTEVKENETQGQNVSSSSTFCGTTNTASDSQQQHQSSTSQKSQNMSSDGPPMSNQTASMSRGPEENVRIKEEQSPGNFQRIVRIKREPGNVEYWPEDSPMFTIKRGPIDDFRPLKDELKNEKTV